MKEQTCCFSGHRIIPLFERTTVSNALEKMIIESIKNGYRYFGDGGALGLLYDGCIDCPSVKKQISANKTDPCSAMRKSNSELEKH